MSLYLLDTTTISDYLRRQPQVTSSLLKVNPSNIYISAISKYELAFGLYKKPSLKSIFGNQIEELYRLTNDLAFTTPISEVAAKIANELKVKGEPIGVPDTLIAATGVYEKLTVVTSNTKHYGKVEGLNIVDWKLNAN